MLSIDCRKASRLIVRLFAVGALATLGSCGGSLHGSGNTDAGGAEVGASPEASVESGLDAGRCLIQASDYDQSCSVDSDCVTKVISGAGFLSKETGGDFIVTFGNFCSPMCLCGPGAISQKSVSQYVADVSKTPLGTGAVPLEACFCDELGILCCQSGQCSDQCNVAPPRDAASPGE